MALKYRLVQRKTIGPNAQEGEKKYFAQGFSNGTMEFDELCQEISENSSLTSGDTKAVIDRLVFCLDKHLRAGRSVHLGELGTFRMAVGSSGAVTEKDFDQTKLMKVPRIVFTAGSKLQNARTVATFERQEPIEVMEDCDKPHLE